MPKMKKTLTAGVVLDLPKDCDRLKLLNDTLRSVLAIWKKYEGPAVLTWEGEWRTPDIIVAFNDRDMLTHHLMFSYEAGSTVYPQLRVNVTTEVKKHPAPPV